MTLTSLCDNAVADKLPELRLDLVFGFYKQSVFVFIEAGNGLYVLELDAGAAMSGIKRARLELLAGCSSDVGSVALIAAVDCVPSEDALSTLCLELAIDDTGHFIELHILLADAVDLVIDRVKLSLTTLPVGSVSQ